jgi:hypothetical protein
MCRVRIDLHVCRLRRYVSEFGRSTEKHGSSSALVQRESVRDSRRDWAVVWAYLVRQGDGRSRIVQLGREGLERLYLLLLRHRESMQELRSLVVLYRARVLLSIVQLQDG